MAISKKQKYKEKKAIKHQFALYIYGLTSLLKQLSPTGILCIKSELIFHRITRVLRLSVEDSLIVFDRDTHAEATIARFGKEEIDLHIQSFLPNKPLRPAITFGLPLLKRDALEQALYSLVEAGVNQIQLIQTAQSGTNWTEKDHARAERIIISAAEQSKYFAFGYVKEPITLPDFIASARTTSDCTIFFDPSGLPAQESINRCTATNPQHITALIGPESDLSPLEKEMLLANQFTFCALTPTILQAKSAAPIGAALLRSLIKS